MFLKHNNCWNYLVMAFCFFPHLILYILYFWVYCELAYKAKPGNEKYLDNLEPLTHSLLSLTHRVACVGIKWRALLKQSLNLRGQLT